MDLRAVAWLRALGWIAAALATALAWAKTHEKSTEAPIPMGVAVIRNATYRVVEDKPLAIDLYLPDGPFSAPRPALLALHGGSWVGGARRDYGDSLARLAMRGFVVAAADYRLARPGAPSWPGALDDAAEAVDWLRDHAEELAIDPDRIAAVGTSAGGLLAAHLALGAPTNDGGRALPDPRVCAAVCLSTPYDLAAVADARALAHEPAFEFVGTSDGVLSRRLIDASPIARVAPHARPMLLIHGTDDFWTPIDQARRMRDKLAKTGVFNRLSEIEGARHGFELQVGAPNPRDLAPEVLEFLENVHRRPRPTPHDVAIR